METKTLQRSDTGVLILSPPVSRDAKVLRAERVHKTSLRVREGT